MAAILWPRAKRQQLPLPNAGNIPDFFEWAAQQHQLDPNLVARVIHAESSGNPNAVSPKGATGLMQLMPGTARDMGVMNVNDPVDNYLGGIKYLDQNKRQFGTDEKALAAYNFGPGHVARGDALPRETQDYIAKILGPQQQEGQHLMAQPAQTQSAAPDFLEWASQQQQGAPAEKEYSVGGFMNNVGTDVEDTVTGVVNALSDIPGTAKALGRLALGTAQHVVPGMLEADYGDQRPVAAAVGNQLKQEVLHPIDSLYDRPISTLMDAATIIPGVGGLVGGAGKALGLERVAQVGRGISKVGHAVDPLNIVTQPLKELGIRSYGRNLSPSPTLQTKAGMNTREFAKLGLKNGINDTKAGFEKIDQIQRDLMTERNATVDRASQAGMTGNAHQMMNDLFDWGIDKKGLGIQPAPEAAQAALMDFIQEFMRNDGRKGFLPLNDMQALKEGAYASMPNNAFVQPPTAAKRMISEKFSQMLKDGVEQGSVGFENGGRAVGDLNKEYGQLKNLQEALQAESKRGSGIGPKQLMEVLGSTFIGHPVLGFLGMELAQSNAAAQAMFRAPGMGHKATQAAALLKALSAQD